MLTMKGFCIEHTTPHEKTMACSLQCRLQVLGVDVGAVEQILQVYVSNNVWLLHLSRLAVLEVPDVLQHALLVCQVLDEGLPYARRNCICGFVCCYNRKKEPRGSFEVRGSSLLCLILSVSFVASFIMLVQKTKQKTDLVRLHFPHTHTLSLSLSLSRAPSSASQQPPRPFSKRPSACSHSFGLSRSRTAGSSGF